MNKLIITFASSKFGKETIRFLLNNGYDKNNIIALVRNELKLDELKDSGIIIKRINFDNYESILFGCEDGERMLFISSGDIDNRYKQHPDIVKAAKQVGIKHIIYTSLARSTIDNVNSPIAHIENCHIITENDIKASGIQYTILRNGLYTDYIVEQFIDSNLLSRPGFYFPSDSLSTVNYATRKDEAEVAAKLLLHNDKELLINHSSKIYTVTGIEPISFDDIVQTITSVLKLESNLPYISVPIELYKKELSKLGQSSNDIDLKISFAQAIDLGEFNITNNKSDLPKLLGRDPTTLKQYFINYFNNSKQ